MKLTDKANISLIIGPMYSGKSTELTRRLNIYSEMGFRVAYANSALDIRTDSAFSTHNPAKGFHQNIHSLKTNELETIDFSNYDVIGIDEAQFFKGLVDFCLDMADKKGKIVIVAGLPGDFKRQKFGEIVDLVPVCDDLQKLTAFCKPCMDSKKEITPAHFTKRISGGFSTIQIGAADSYIPVCRVCYLE